MGTQSELKKLREIIRLGSELNELQDLDILLEKILYEARVFTNADAGTIYIRKGTNLLFTHAQNDTLVKKLPSGHKLPYKSFKMEINKKSVSGYVAETGEILNIKDMYAIPGQAPYHFDPGYDKKVNYKTISTLTVPLKTNRNEIIGVLQIINAKDDNGNITTFDSMAEPLVLHFSNIASMILQRAQLTRALLLRMINMAELRDPKETGPHVNRVASYAVEIYERWAIQKNISKSELDKNRDILRMAAMLHDVGKVAIPDVILKKPGRFSDREYEIMKQHTYRGARLFQNTQSEFDDIAYQVALTHHENWDGTGYPGKIDVMTGNPLEKDSEGKPRTLKGEDIPIYGRIVALADVYDALSCCRVYKKAWKEKDVLSTIKDLSGKKFDPALVDIFFDSFKMIKAIKKKYPDSENQDKY
ncbi:MAG: HD domain-containing protein [Spirochaetales bacterium]|nr:HD domain-containing protein [Spirochaetales bacterium]